MTQFVPPKKNDANGFVFYTVLSSRTADGTFLANPTLATGDVLVSIDGADFANLGTLPAVTPAAGKAVKVTLAQGEINGDNIVVKFVDAAGAEWCDKFFNFQTVARQIDDLAFPGVSGRGIDVSVGGEVGLDWANIGSPTTTVGLSGTTVKTATDVETDTQDIQTTLGVAGAGLTAVASQVWDLDATAHQTAGTFGIAIGDPLAGTSLLARIGTPTDLGGGATIAGNLVDIEGQTDDIGAAGAGLTAVWSVATRTLTAIDEDSTTLDLDATVRAAVGMGSANLDTQLADLPTNAELATALGTADDAVLTAIGALNDLSSADVTAAVPTALQNADALLDRANAVEIGVTPRGALRIAASVLAGKVSGGQTGTETFRNMSADSKNRVVSTNDAQGNRTAVVLDMT